MFLPLPVLLLPFLFAALYSPLHSKNALTHTIGTQVNLADGTTQRANILLLTAHPDDECLFFGPTILSIIAQSRISPHETSLSSLCLSTGNADGLGDIRTKELSNSLDILGIMQDSRQVLNIPELQDNGTLSWEPQVIADVVEGYIQTHKINTILTFDYGGISGHPNHASIPRGVRLLLRKPVNKHLRAYALITVPLVQKYIGPMSSLHAKFDLSVQNAWRKTLILLVRVWGLESVPSVTPPTHMPVFVAGFWEYWTLLTAMRAHPSQLVWFRWLNVSFSRYMWVNEWVEIRP